MGDGEVLFAVEVGSVVYRVGRVEENAGQAVFGGDDPLLRIALCGYDGEHNVLEEHGWSVQAWKAHGGYGSQGEGQGRANARRERIWFSPACLSPQAQQGALW